MGAMAAGASEDVCAAVEAFGRDVGLAFQVVDDVLDATSTAGDLGKEPSDAELDKSTYVVLLGVDGARDHGRALIERARGALDRVSLEAPRLRELSAYVINRER